MDRDEIVKEIQEYSDLLEKMQKMGLLEAEELEVLQAFGII